jgi:hypothetical protein
MKPWLRILFAALAFCASVFLNACPPHPSSLPSAVPPSSVERPHIPPGCSVTLSGSYVHALDPSFRYRGQDDGTTLVLEVNRTFPDGGTFGPKAVPSIRLARTPKGFLGRTRAVGILQSGEVCPVVEFLTEVVSCDDAGIVLRSAASTRVDEACRPPELATPAPLLEQRLNRTPSPPGAPDGGSAPQSSGSRE